MATRYWVGDSGTWTDTGHWSTSSGGASGSSVPGASDDAIFDAASFSADGAAIDGVGGIAVGTLNMSAVDQTVTLTMVAGSGNGTLNLVHNNLRLNNKVTINGLHINYSGGDPAIIDQNGAILNLSTSVGFSAQGAFNNATILSNLVITGTGNTITIQGASVDLAGFNITGGQTTLTAITNILSSGSTITTTGSIDINGALVGGDFVFNGSSNYTADFLGSTGSINSLTINPSLGAGTMTISTSTITVGTLSINMASGGAFSTRVVKFKEGVTTTIGSLTLTADATHIISVRSITDGQQHTISITSSSVSYIDAKDSIAAGAGIPIDDRIGGIDSGNTINWLFPTSLSPSKSPSTSPSGSPSSSPSISPSPSPNNDLFLQNIFFVGSDSAGDVQMINIGKNDDAIPIYYELETQELEFDNRAFNKSIGGKLGIISQEAADSKIQIREDEKDYKDIRIDLSKRVNIETLPNLKAHYATMRWSGNTSSSSPILEGFFLDNIKDEGL